MLSCTRGSLVRVCLVQNAKSPAANKLRQTWDRSPLLFRAALPPAAHRLIVPFRGSASTEQFRNNNWPAHSRAGLSQTAPVFPHRTAAPPAQPFRFFRGTSTQRGPRGSSPPLRKASAPPLRSFPPRRAPRPAPPESWPNACVIEFLS